VTLQVAGEAAVAAAAAAQGWNVEACSQIIPQQPGTLQLTSCDRCVSSLCDVSVHIVQVAIGEAVSSSIAHYLAAQEAAGGVSCDVITVPEECGTADALRLVAKHITAETLVVYSGDILTDLPVKALLATHQVGHWVCLLPWQRGKQTVVNK